MVQDFTSSAQAVCNNSLKETDYFGNDVQLYFILVLLMPVMITAILVLVIRSTHNSIHTKLTQSLTGYRNLAGLTLASIHILMFVLVMDCFAVHYYNTDMHELSHNAVRGHINLFSTAMTISFDLLVTLQFLFFMIYLSCALFGDEYRITKWFLESGLLCLIMPYFYAMLGKEEMEQMIRDLKSSDRDENKIKKKLKTWVVSGIMFAPLFSFASHAGYILLAWVTEPARTTAIFLAAVASFLYLFLLFRQCYVVYEDTENEGLFSCVYLLLMPLLTVALHIKNMAGLTKRILCNSGYENIDSFTPQKTEFSLFGFFVACSWGWLIAGSLVFVLYTLFFKMPITVSSSQLTATLETTVQIIVVVLGFLISVRLFAANNSSETAKLPRSRNNYVEDMELSGIEGELIQSNSTDPPFSTNSIVIL